MPADKKKPIITLRTTRETHALLAMAACQSRTSMNKFCVGVLEERLKKMCLTEDTLTTGGN